MIAVGDILDRCPLSGTVCIEGLSEGRKWWRGKQKRDRKEGEEVRRGRKEEDEERENDGRWKRIGLYGG